MNWLPIPKDFARELKAAAVLEDVGERAEKLAALTQSRLGFVETIQLDNVLRARPLGDVPGFSKVRLAVLASSTIDHLLPAIRVGGLRRKLLIETYTPPYGQYRQVLLDPTAGIHEFRADTVLFSVASSEAIAGIPLGVSRDDAEDALTRAVADLRELWRRAREQLGAAVIQQSFLDTSEPVFGNYDRFVPGSPARLIMRLNELIAVAAAEDGVLLLDVARSSARDGLDVWFDITRWLQGKIEIAPQAAARYGDMVGRIVAAQRGHSKKCLVLDLDNTLWGGVVGDVGLEGILLGQGSAVGEAHLNLQRYAKELKERGVILAICSKNEMNTALAAFRSHPEMLLKEADVAAFAVNWDDKAANLRAIAQQLNIGLDSLVFVDDNPVERARIRESLPMVAVPEMPEDPAYYVRCLASAGYFEAVGFTNEDRDRAAQYAANRDREALRSSYQSMDDFLQGLQMSLIWGRVASIDLARVTQLINKTNQFNTTTRRMTAEELSRLTAGPENLVLQFRLLDKFGDNGIVSVLIASPGSQSDVFEITDWVMSCRVFGRQLEDEAMNILVEMLLARGVRELRAEFIPTAKNAVIKDLYRNLGFQPLGEAAADGRGWWKLGMTDYTHRPTQIGRQEQV